MVSTSRDFTAGQVFTAAQADGLSQGVISYATPLTASVGPTSGTTPLDIITAPAVTIARTGRRIRITFHCRGNSGTVAGDTFLISIREGGTILQDAVFCPPGTTLTGIANHVIAYVSPTAASHTYKATITRNSGTGTATVQASADSPITLTVEDVGEAT